MSRSRRMDALAGVAGAALVLLIASPAGAQSCVQESASATRCRLVLSQPRALTVQAGALLDRGPRTPVDLAITVDGRPCREDRETLRDRLAASCPVKLSAAEHMIEAVVVSPGRGVRGVGVDVLPNPSLAPLPREAADLTPKERVGVLRRLAALFGQ